MHQNVRSLNKSADLLLNLVLDYKPDFLGLSEHWLTDEQLHTIQIDGYELVSSFCRGPGQRGGAALFCKKGIKCRERMDLTRLSIEGVFECAAIELKCSSRKLVVACIYRIPDNSNYEVFSQRFNELCEAAHKEVSNVAICGDFNIDLMEDSGDRNRADFLSLLNTYNLLQTIKEPTRITDSTKSCIDNVFVNSFITFSALVIEAHISDHTAQYIQLDLTFKKQQNFVFRRNFSEYNISSFYDALKTESWTSVFDFTDVDDKWDSFLDTFTHYFDLHFPIKKMYLDSIKKPVQSPEIEEIKHKLNIYCILSKYFVECKQTYMNLKKQYQLLLRTARSTYYKNRLDRADNKPKITWQIVQELTNTNNKKSQHVPSGDLHKLANDFNLHFSKLGLQNCAVNSNSSFPCDIGINPKSIYFAEVTENELISMSKEFKNKNSAGEDKIPLSLLKKCITVFVKPLTDIINASIYQGKFPEQLKHSLVMPLHKKGEKDKIENYRPISLLSSFSKFFEKAIYNRIINFFQSCKLFNSFQHGFLANKSIETAVFSFTEEVLDALERGELACGLFLDLSKAFDSLNHNLLLDKLYRYGVRGVALAWLRSYLHGRSQRVILAGNSVQTFSDRIYTSMGIPQGSILGPLLFIIYLNDIPTAINSENFMMSYADDNSVLVTSKTFEDIASLSEAQFNELENWYRNNYLKLNVDKTQCLLFRTSHNKKYFPDNLKLGNTTVNFSNSTKLLGIYIDFNLNFQSHIDQLENKLSSVCYALRVLIRYLDINVVKSAYYANFYSRMKYGIVFWGLSTHFDRVFKIQKRAIRILYKMSFRDSCRGVFRRNSLLTAMGLYIYECILFLRKYPHLFEGNLIDHSYDTRRLSAYNYPTHHMTLKEKGCFYSCLKLYNSLPGYLKNIKSFEPFKKAVFKLICEIEPYDRNEFYAKCADV